MSDPTLATFADVRTMLKALIAAIAPPAPNGVGWQVEWENRKRPFIDPQNQAMILLKTSGMQGLGYDEDRSTYDGSKPLGEELTITKCGNRKFRFTIKVESSDYDLNTADVILAYMYTRLQWDSSDALLLSANCAYIDDSPMVTSDFVRDGNYLSAALIEFVIGWAVNDTDAANPGGYITEVVIDGDTLKNTDGTARVPQPHIDVITP